jgi:hypothetical protein
LGSYVFRLLIDSGGSTIKTLNLLKGYSVCFNARRRHLKSSTFKQTHFERPEFPAVLEFRNAGIFTILGAVLVRFGNNIIVIKAAVAPRH